MCYTSEVTERDFRLLKQQVAKLSRTVERLCGRVALIDYEYILYAVKSNSGFDKIWRETSKDIARFTTEGAAQHYINECRVHPTNYFHKGSPLASYKYHYVHVRKELVDQHDDLPLDPVPPEETKWKQYQLKPTLKISTR